MMRVAKHVENRAIDYFIFARICQRFYVAAHRGVIARYVNNSVRGFFRDRRHYRDDVMLGTNVIGLIL